MSWYLAENSNDNECACNKSNLLTYVGYESQHGKLGFIVSLT